MNRMVAIRLRRVVVVFVLICLSFMLGVAVGPVRKAHHTALLAIHSEPDPLPAPSPSPIDPPATRVAFPGPGPTTRPLVAAKRPLLEMQDRLSTGGRGTQWKSFSELNEFYVSHFVNSEGFGSFRMNPAYTPEFKSVHLEKQNYRVKKVELVSLQKEDSPFVYKNESLPQRSGLRVSARRPITNDEFRGVESLLAGRQVVRVGTPTKPALVGALRADDSCLNCHDAKKGALLGAFVYSLEPEMN